MALPFLGNRSKQYETLDALNEVNVSEAIRYSNADRWIVFKSLATQQDVAGIMSELKRGNVVIFEVQASRGNPDIVGVVDALKTEVYKIDGDLAKIAETKMIASPQRMKIRRN